MRLVDGVVYKGDLKVNHAFILQCNDYNNNLNLTQLWHTYITALALGYYLYIYKGDLKVNHAFITFCNLMTISV